MFVQDEFPQGKVVDNGEAKYGRRGAYKRNNGQSLGNSRRLGIMEVKIRRIRQLKPTIPWR